MKQQQHAWNSDTNRHVTNITYVFRRNMMMMMMMLLK